MKIRPYLLYLLFLLTGSTLRAQLSTDSITQPYIQETITWLASDKMGGRVNYTKQQLEAATFLKEEFSSFGLVPFTGMNDFFVPFRIRMSKEKAIGQLQWNGSKLADSLYYFFSERPYTDKLNLEDFIILETTAPVSNRMLAQHWNNKQRTLIWIKHPEGASATALMKDVVIPIEKPGADLLVVVQPDAPQALTFTEITGNLGPALYNVVGMLPGKSKPEEAIIFSAHYDHVDHGLDGQKGPIFNGANDNASGTTGVLALAKYFAKRKDNERTLIFCLFAGEELGLLGSRDFAAYVNPAHIKAVINLEMIGVTNATGKNAFMLTGPEHSNLFEILKDNLKGSDIKIQKLNNDPNQLFMRSDNYSFFQRDIVAHTIMCSDDEDRCYHKPCDDVKNINIPNMVRVIRGIAQSARTLISGADTPVLKSQ